MKLFLYITQAPSYLNGHIRYHATQDEVTLPTWLLAGTIDFEPQVTDKGLLKHAILNLQAEETELRANFQIQLDTIEEQKQKLLSLPHLKAVSWVH